MKNPDLKTRFRALFAGLYTHCELMARSLAEDAHGVKVVFYTRPEYELFNAWQTHGVPTREGNVQSVEMNGLAMTFLTESADVTCVYFPDGGQLSLSGTPVYVTPDKRAYICHLVDDAGRARWDELFTVNGSSIDFDELMNSLMAQLLYLPRFSLPLGTWALLFTS